MSDAELSSLLTLLAIPMGGLIAVGILYAVLKVAERLEEARK